ncbi:MAG: hypothetical protein ACLQU2_01265 [Candidatus Binataceae bacterium]
MRALSAFWALLATVIFYRLWLREEEERTQRMFLALWVLSPCLLLYGRMARSYSMQLALALLTIYAAVEWMKRPRNVGGLLAYSCSCAALLYTHYLPGLAILIAVSLVFLWKPHPPLLNRVALLGVSNLIIGFLYLPWLITLGMSIGAWGSNSVYRVGNLASDQIVRLAYWFVSFSFGETVSTPIIIAGAVLTPIFVYALYSASRSRPDWLGLVAAASIIGYIGVSRWNGFPFTPSHMLFVLPFFLILLVKGVQASYRHESVIFACLLVLYVSADYNYFAKSGYLNKSYCVPYEEMAAVIREGTPAQGAVVLVDEYSSVPEPLFERLGRGVRVIPVVDEEGVDRQLEEVGRNAPVIWFWRHTHDTSPSGFVSRLERELSRGRTVTQYDYLPYTTPERWILRVLRGPGQPKFFYRLSEIR